MTAGMSQTRKRRTSLGLRGCLLTTMAVAAASSVGFAATAPSAIAADAQLKQWYLEPMHAEEMWKTTTGEGIKVVVIDTGVNSSTPSLEGQVLKGLDATNADGDETDDYNGHGTTMAELIAGTGKGGGLRGLAPGAKIIPMRVADTDFQNKNSVNAYDTADSIRAAADSDAQIISMSFGSEFKMDREIEAVKYAQRKGKLFFAAVGNEAEKGNKAIYPAAYPEVVGVGATDKQGKVSDTSQHGDFVDIAAPGDDLPFWCDENFERYCQGNGGTSAATAITSASAALIWSAHPEWTANQVLNVLFDTAGRGDWEKGTLSNYLGHGIIRPAVNILKGTGDPGEADISPLTKEKTSGSEGSGAPSASASSQPEKKDKAEDAAMAGSSTEKNDSSQLGLILGGVAVVLVIGGGAFALVRKRRSA
ncbi:S8 family serine peptidase [Streptomyces sp. NPDC049952]|uniref:S8 family serine peptidase n=1 Tax=[Kitasatospora] papulosa TaxID=1464011 RepID=A0ABZ1KAY0_9ACTN|nr:MULTISPECIES: S8 family serine peptidase [Streptomyces]MEE1775649.1 S8 family serine peptidase [Streptomyces sp. JV181]TPM95513.1 serine protease [Mesorhizobium sp. B2-3-3]WKV77651.1 S8 family serine peptidase [Streptomyces sp. SNU607]